MRKPHQKQNMPGSPCRLVYRLHWLFIRRMSLYLSIESRNALSSLFFLWSDIGIIVWIVVVGKRGIPEACLSTGTLIVSCINMWFPLFLSFLPALESNVKEELAFRLFLLVVHSSLRQVRICNLSHLPSFSGWIRDCFEYFIALAQTLEGTWGTERVDWKAWVISTGQYMMQDVQQWIWREKKQRRRRPGEESIENSESLYFIL